MPFDFIERSNVHDAFEVSDVRRTSASSRHVVSPCASQKWTGKNRETDSRILR